MQKEINKKQHKRSPLIKIEESHQNDNILHVYFEQHGSYSNPKPNLCPPSLNDFKSHATDIVSFRSVKC
jgi:hypothetical protein